MLVRRERDRRRSGTRGHPAADRRHTPSGVATSTNSKMAYVSVIGSGVVTKVDLTTLKLDGNFNIGPSPRHLVVSPDGAYLYASLNDARRGVQSQGGHRGGGWHPAHRYRGPLAGDIRRWPLAVRHQLRLGHRHQAACVGLERASDFSTGEPRSQSAYDANTGNVWVALSAGGSWCSPTASRREPEVSRRGGAPDPQPVGLRARGRGRPGRGRRRLTAASSRPNCASTASAQMSGTVSVRLSSIARSRRAT